MYSMLDDLCKPKSIVHGQMQLSMFKGLKVFSAKVLHCRFAQSQWDVVYVQGQHHILSIM